MKNFKPHNVKIGIVLSSVPGYSETFFRNKIKGLQDNGFEVILFVDYNPSNNADFPCEIVSSPDFSGTSFKKFVKSITSVLKALFFQPKRSLILYKLDKTDGVVFKRRLKNLILNQFLLTKSLDWLHFGFGMLAKDRENVAQAIGAKMAVSFRGYDLYLSPLKHPGCYDILFKKDARYHVLSEGMKRTLMDYKINVSQIQKITPAIDTSFFQKQKDNLPKESNDILQIITVARLHWKKGLEYTLQALALLKEQGVKFNYTIIGLGKEHERLVFAAYQLGIMDNIQFVGKLTPLEVKKQLEQATLYLQYSIQEGFCNAVLEAQSMGLLCIVSNAEGLDENVLDMKTGWVVTKRQPENLAQKIMDVIQLPILKQQQIQQLAFERVQKEFNLELQNAAFCNFYMH
jgi:colanic acid/amylovoran biosynthesis glycosyltransferase